MRSYEINDVKETGTGPTNLWIHVSLKTSIPEFPGGNFVGFRLRADADAKEAEQLVNLLAQLTTHVIVP